MQTLTVHLFRESFGPFVRLLDEHGIKFQMREVRTGAPMASGGTIELIRAVGDVAMWTSLAAVLVAYIKSRSSRKVIITTKDGMVVHAEGLSHQELEALLDRAQNLTAIDTSKTLPDEKTARDVGGL
ncbi:MAG: effector-associated constant component EACC1 [Burkholderiaceae bacterium]